MNSEVQEFGPQGCPFLGLEEDRSVMLLDASPLHRCHAVPSEKHTPTLQYQSDTCLCQAHTECPRFQRALPLGDVVKPPPRSKPRVQSKTPMILAATATLLVLAAIGWLASSFLGPRDTNASGTPTVASVAIAPAATDGSSADAAGAAGSNVQVGAGVSPEAVATLDGTAAPAAETVAAATATPPPADGDGAISIFDRVTPTPIPGGEVYQLRSSTSNAGWWLDSDPTTSHLNDSFLYAGGRDGVNYVSGVRFDLSRIPRGAPLMEGRISLTGLRAEQMNQDTNATWLVQLVSESELATLGGADFMGLYSAPASITLPQLSVKDIGVGKTNTWELDARSLRWLEQQRLDGAKSVVMRILGDGVNTVNSLFGWDSGLGSVSGGNAPVLELMAGAAPTATPPLPTRDFIVATFTPAPANVVTVQAQQQTATAVAASVGTYTPMPYFVTPTSQPQNLATVQASALLAGQPPVVLETPVPANEATATEIANFATAVAATTGTYTPVPAVYVTPFLVLPSPPPDNLLTVVARSAEATAVAESGEATPTPLPYNAVIAAYVIATVTPESVVTAAAMNREATAAAEINGTATPTPWEVVVLLPTPQPKALPPTATPTLPPLILERDFTPTPTPLPGATEIVPATLPDEFRNKIIFRTNRTGAEEVFLLDPATGDTGKVTRDWVYPLAANQLAVSPDGKKIAIVKPDIARVLQIYVRSLEFGTDTQITNFSRDSYDPAWSPTGEWIAFVGTNSGNDEVYRASPDGQTVQQLTQNSYEWDKHPTWSPDGSEIVFYSNRDTGRRQLWVMDADGGSQRNLTSDEYENWDPIWTR